MNTAAGLVTGSPLQAVLQISTPTPDTATSVAASGDFTAAMAAACVAGPEPGMPEGMQSAAALAWLAGFMSPALPAQSVVQPDMQLQSSPGTEVLTDFSDDPLADSQPGADVLAAAALSLLQGMLAPVSHVPRGPDLEAGAEPGTDPGALPVAAPAGAVPDVERAAFAAPLATPLAAPGAVNSNVVATVSAPDLEDTSSESTVIPGSAPAADGPAAAARRAAPAAVRNALMRAFNIDAQPEVPAAVQGDSNATATIAIESAAKQDSSADASVGERLIGALADRASLRVDSAGTPVDADRSIASGPNLYASTRETVANAAGAVSSRPEVVHATVGSPRWANELGSRLAMMSVRGQQEGSLSLTPEHLGPLEVRISVNQDTTNVWFGAQHADTRAALAEALPRLREMFAESGLALGHAGVSHEMPGQEARQGEASAFRVEGDFEAADSAPVALARISSGLLDAWA